MLSLYAVDASGSPRDYAGTLPAPAHDALRATASLYDVAGFREPWIGYLAVRDGEAVGMCGFKSPPVNGRVEIAYFTFPAFEGRGVATAMATRLVALARETDPAVQVTAQTLPEPNASTRILERLGFVRAGTAQDPDVGTVWAWELPRTAPGSWDVLGVSGDRGRRSRADPPDPDREGGAGTARGPRRARRGSPDGLEARDP